MTTFLHDVIEVECRGHSQDEMHADVVVGRYVRALHTMRGHPATPRTYEVIKTLRRKAEEEATMYGVTALVVPVLDAMVIS